MTPLPKLLPCPFDGGKARAFSTVIKFTSTEEWWISCQTCAATLPGVDRTFGGEDEAVAAWNKRAK